MKKTDLDANGSLVLIETLPDGVGLNGVAIKQVITQMITAGQIDCHSRDADFDAAIPVKVKADIARLKSARLALNQPDGK